MHNPLIDSWDIGTYDNALLTALRESADLVRQYVDVDRRAETEHERQHNLRRHIQPPANPHSAAYGLLEEKVAALLRDRTIRAFHNTRLTDGEVEVFRRDGVYLSKLETLRARLDARVTDGDLTAAEADIIFAASPLREQAEVRSSMFWMTSHPIGPDSPLVEDLLIHWGGEGAYAGIDDPALVAKLQAIGRPRIIEVALPLAVTDDAPKAATTVLRAFAYSLGCVVAQASFDACALRPLPASSILAIHTEGDASFHGMGRNYPPGYVDPDLHRRPQRAGKEG